MRRPCLRPDDRDPFHKTERLAMKRKTSRELSLHDRPSRLGFLQACKLLGENGKPPLERVPLETPSGKALVRKALEERAVRAREEKMKVRSVDPGQPWTDYSTVSAASPCSAGPHPRHAAAAVLQGGGTAWPGEEDHLQGHVTYDDTGAIGPPGGTRRHGLPTRGCPGVPGSSLPGPCQRPADHPAPAPASRSP